MKALRNPNGITIKQLKELVCDLPEINPATGEDYEVWVDGTACEPGVSNIAKSIWQLNKGDIIFEIDRTDVYGCDTPRGKQGNDSNGRFFDPK